jgi:hypothetical protein
VGKRRTRLAAAQASNGPLNRLIAVKVACSIEAFALIDISEPLSKKSDRRPARMCPVDGEGHWLLGATRASPRIKGQPTSGGFSAMRRSTKLPRFRRPELDRNRRFGRKPTPCFGFGDAARRYRALKSRVYIGNSLREEHGRSVRETDHENRVKPHLPDTLELWIANLSKSKGSPFQRNQAVPSLRMSSDQSLSPIDRVSGHTCCTVAAHAASLPRILPPKAKRVSFVL